MRVETSSGMIVEADVEAFVAALIQQLSPADLTKVLKQVESNQFANSVEVAPRPPFIHSA